MLRSSNSVFEWALSERPVIFWNWRRKIFDSWLRGMNNSRIIAAVGLASLTGVGGFLAGKRTGNSQSSSETDALPTKSSLQGSLVGTKGVLKGGAQEPNLRGFELSRNPKAGLELLLEELRQSPMSQMDFEALFNIWDMVQYLDAHELEFLIAELEEMGGGQEMMSVRMMMLNRWAAKDGLAAMESVFEGEKGMMQMIGAMGAMMGWMRSDPEQAYSWFQENGDRMGGSAMGIGKAQIEAIYFASKARTDFEGTMAELDGMEVAMQKTIVEQLAQSAGMDKERRNELLGYLKSKGDDSLLDSARNNIVQQMAWHDPEGVIAFIESEGLDGENRRSLVDQATAMWSQSDPQGAVEFLGEELKGQENAGDQISDSFGRWVSQDEAGAAKWLATQTDEFKTDSVFRDAGNSLINSKQYERSAEWYGQILDDEQRGLGYQGLYIQWREDDQEAADAWQANLPPEDSELFVVPQVSEALEEVEAIEEVIENASF